MNRLPSSARARLLKQASQELVALLGGIEGAAATLERGKSAVGRWVNPNDAEHWIGVADCAALEAVAGKPVVTELLCKLAGGVFVPHVDLSADEGTAAGLVLKLTKELGEVASAVGEALSDGQWEGAEAQAALDQLDDLDTVSAQLRGVLRAVLARECGDG